MKEKRKEENKKGKKKEEEIGKKYPMKIKERKEKK